MYKKLLPVGLFFVLLIPPYWLLYGAVTSPSLSIGDGLQAGATPASQQVVKGLSIAQGRVYGVTTGFIQTGNQDASGITAGTQGDASHIPLLTFDGAGRATGFTNTPMVVQDKGGQVFNVMSYGAKGDGITDDTIAFQAAIDAAIVVNGDVAVPAPPGGSYVFNNSLTIQPKTGSSFVTIKIIGNGGYTPQLTFKKAKSSFIQLIAGYFCRFNNINITMANSAANSIAWDCQITSPLLNSQTANVWDHCNVYTGTSGHCIGWRTGQYQSSAYSGMAFFKWDTCAVHGQSKQYGDVGWQIGGRVTTPETFVNCWVLNIGITLVSGALGNAATQAIGANDTVINVGDTLLFPPTGTLIIDPGSGLSTPEQCTYTVTSTTQITVVRGQNGTAAVAHPNGCFVAQYVVSPFLMGWFEGGYSINWYGGNGSGNAYDFFFQFAGRYSIIGYRGETGGRFLQCGGWPSNYLFNVRVVDVDMAFYTEPSDNLGLFLLNGVTTLKIEGCHITSQTGVFSAHFIQSQALSSGSAIETDHSAIMVGQPPFWQSGTGNPLRVSSVGTQLLNTDGTVNAVMRMEGAFNPTDQATITIDTKLGPNFLIALSSTVGATRNLALSHSQRYQKFTLRFTQPATGGPCDIGTWFAGQTIQWLGGTVPHLTATANAVDEIDFTVIDATHLLGTPRLNYH